MSWDLRCGPWQDTLAGVECDALIVDAPYSARTHGGHNLAIDHGAADNARKGTGRRRIDYDCWDWREIDRFVEEWSHRTRGWFVTITDHVSAPTWAESLESCGRYVFAPIPWVASGGGVRLSGDGPASWTCWIVVARPRDRRFMGWGALPGAYLIKKDRGSHIGGKPAALMRALVRDYTRPGDLVCDPCAGGGTTLLAAVQEGRRAIGSELDPETHAKAVERLKRKLAQGDLWAACERVRAEQPDLL